MLSLPVATELNRIVAAAREAVTIVTAPPGSGKTTLVPSALLNDLPNGQQVILVQPRRLAARAVARWIAQSRNTRVGGEVGYQVRFDSQTSAQTRLFVVTTGILLRRFQSDPLLEQVGTVVLDEFHERTVEMDLALGMLRRLRDQLRPELRLVIMSATLQATELQNQLVGAQVIHAEGRRFPVDIRYLKQRDQSPVDEQIAQLIEPVARTTTGHVLTFLPGVGEIHRTRERIEPAASRAGFDIFTLFGDMAAEDQDRVLGESPNRKWILATNIAETSLTIDGVTAVIDSGLARQMRVAPDVGLPRLELIPISQASADQRAGRAGRTAPGICWRLWETAAHQARPSADPPEILRSDLSTALLHLIAWGERDFERFPWVTSPPQDAVDAAAKLLELLGAMNSQRQITPLGQALAELPAHPRLARLILAGAELGVLREASIAAALLSERDPFRVHQHGKSPRDQSTQRSHSDIVDRVIALQRHHQGERDTELDCHPGAARQVLRAAEQFYRLAQSSRGERSSDPESALRYALWVALPDRLAKLRQPGSDRAAMVGGRGVKLDRSSRVQGETLFVAVEVHDAPGDARVRLASAVERDWIQGAGLRTSDELFFNPSRGQVEARRRTYWMDLLLEESPIEVQDYDAATELLMEQARHQLDRMLPETDSPAAQWMSRSRWLAHVFPEMNWPRFDEAQVLDLLRSIAYGKRSLEAIRQGNWLEQIQETIGYDRLHDFERLAPAKYETPRGKKFGLAYRDQEPPILAVRIQEMFGVKETPRVADGRIPVLLHLLGPNFRPQQVTSDLASFWRNTYPTVKKELKRRYPKHAWPDDPISVER